MGAPRILLLDLRLELNNQKIAVMALKWVSSVKEESNFGLENSKDPSVLMKSPLKLHMLLWLEIIVELY